MRMQNKVALVTGAALGYKSGGPSIGSEIAIKLASEGAKIVVVDIYISRIKCYIQEAIFGVCVKMSTSSLYSMHLILESTVFGSIPRANRSGNIANTDTERFNNSFNNLGIVPLFDVPITPS